MEQSFTSLPVGFLDALVNEFDTPNVIGITLGGSYARGDATAYSDIDLACFFQEQAHLPLKQYLYRRGYLVSIASLTLTGVRQRLSLLPDALLIVGGSRQVLLDKDGSVKQLLQELASFNTASLEQQAREYVSFQVAILAEQAHKILSGWSQNNSLSLAYATTKLLLALTEVMMVHYGVLIRNDSSFYQQVQEAVGPTSMWTALHQQLTGSQTQATMMEQAQQVLNLYQETVKLAKPVMQLSHRTVAEQAVQIIDDAFLTLRTNTSTHPIP
jgi:predicted nucleotidyltransferase